MKVSKSLVKHQIKQSIFGCRTVSGDLPHSCRDVSVHWVTSWHLACL